MSIEPPQLLTFDVFGTLVDWRRGLTEALAAKGVRVTPADFDRVVDAQARDEQAGFRSYREITARSLVAESGLDPADADRIGAELGRWPLFNDAPEGLRRLMGVAPCVAMTNSDREHGRDVQSTLGFALSHWICAEDVRTYKPSPEFWRAVSTRLGVPFGRSWWHVSAYADYDLGVARSLGLTTVFVPRPHSRPGSADLIAEDLVDLAVRATESLSGVTRRPATPGDAQFWEDLHVVTLGPYAAEAHGYDEAELRRRVRIEFDPAKCEVILLAGRNVGCMVVEDHGTSLFLDLIALLPAYQSRGIGARLVREVQARAQARCLPVRLSVLRVNPARRFYERLGFRVGSEDAKRVRMEWCGSAEGQRRPR